VRVIICACARLANWTIFNAARLRTQYRKSGEHSFFFFPIERAAIYNWWMGRQIMPRWQRVNVTQRHLFPFETVGFRLLDKTRNIGFRLLDKTQNIDFRRCATGCIPAKRVLSLWGEYHATHQVTQRALAKAKSIK
jgi:hypothetical protein